MELIKNFGIEPWLLAAQVVNFLIILYLLKRFAYKPILQVLKTRQETIKKSLKDAEEARLLLEKTEQKEKEILKKAQEEAKKIIAETKKQSDLMLQEAEARTRKQAERILQEAREQIAYESKQTEKRLSGHISELAVHFLQKTLSGFFSENDQEVIIKQALKKIKSKAD